jgi:CrcB protein
MQNILLISFLGVLGILSRYGIDQSLGSWNENFPLTTFVINILGSFLAGSIYAYSTYREISPGLQTALLVGFCGGFTTFSAYSLQTMLLAEKGKLLPALAYLTLSPALGLAAAFLPFLIVRRFT